MRKTSLVFTSDFNLVVGDHIDTSDHTRRVKSAAPASLHQGEDVVLRVRLVISVKSVYYSCIKASDLYRDRDVSHESLDGTHTR